MIQAIIMGTIFFRLNDTTATFYSRGGVLFLYVPPFASFHLGFLAHLCRSLLSSILFSALTTMAEIPALFSQRPIVLRQFKAAMYHPWAESLALTLVDVPITFVTLTFFCVILYFLVGLQQSASQFLYVSFFICFLDTLFSLLTTFWATARSSCSCSR